MSAATDQLKLLIPLSTGINQAQQLADTLDLLQVALTDPDERTLVRALWGRCLVAEEELARLGRKHQQAQKDKEFREHSMREKNLT